jgi:hypothetical protein
MRIETSQEVIDGLHAWPAKGFPSAGEVARAKNNADKSTKTLTDISFKQVYVGLEIALATLSC